MKAGSLPRLRPKKSLGQHFLRDENITRNIVTAFDPRPEDVVLEIGPGEGVLTSRLASAVRKLVVVEIDPRAAALVASQYGGGGVEVVNADILTMDFAAIASQQGSQLRVIGNIPYNITSPIIFQILNQRTHVRDAVLMIQKEVARRIVAVPHTKDYGILSVFCQQMAETALLFDVPPNAFRPKPAVISSVIRMSLLPALRFATVDQEFFRRMVRSVFGKRRKMLRNSLQYFFAEDQLPLTPDECETLLAAAGSSISLDSRPEELTLRELTELANVLASSPIRVRRGVPR